MGAYHFAKDVTADVAAATVLDLTRKRHDGEADYDFIPQAILINPSADDLVELKTIVCYMSGNNAPVTLRLECGTVHCISIHKIVKSGTTTEDIIILGNQ